MVFSCDDSLQSITVAFGDLIKFMSKFISYPGEKIFLGNITHVVAFRNFDKEKHLHDTLAQSPQFKRSWFTT